MTFILFILFCIAAGNISIVDPHCPLDSAYQYGTASMTHDLLGSSISFNLNFTPQIRPTYSCYLCDAAGREYCNATLNNVLLSNELSFNMMTAMITGDNRVFTRTYNIQRNKPSIILDRPTGFSCTDSLRLVVLLFATVQTPSPMVFLTSLRESNGLYNMTCDDSHLLFEDVDCSVIGPYYYYIPMDSSNCIATNTVTESLTPSTENKPLLYWYKESLKHNTMMNEGKWCGIDWFTLLQQSNVSFLCGAYAPLYVDLKPWYRVALEYVAARFNMERQGINSTPIEIIQTMTIANAYLERSCSLRDTAEKITDTVFASLFITLNRYNEYGFSSKSQWCSEISSYLGKTDMDEDLIPYYLVLYREWYFEYFIFFIMHSKDMWTNVLISIVLLAIAVSIFVLVALIAPLWIIIVECYRRIAMKKYETKLHSNHQYNQL